MTPPKKRQKHAVFFDFDNTITRLDVLDDIIKRFSTDRKWVSLEKAWKDGKIGSRRCLEGQIAGIKVTKAALDDYLSLVRLDRYFRKLITLLGSKGIKPVILSDSFDYIINRILEHNHIPCLKIYSNRLKIKKDRLVPSFPFSNKKCGSCAHCKKTSLLKNSPAGSIKTYVGDGLSDVCASKEADIVFAKGYLRDYFKNNALDHVPFKGLKDVRDYLKKGGL
jgi:2-hydroxy-3-keto-5-methylthiopentenyl-1-phosphate phosphatase